MSVIEYYHRLIQSHDLKPDEEQYRAVVALEELSQSLNEKFKHRKLTSIVKQLFKSQGPIQGIYFHGRVGRGKTMLMDLFYQQLNITRKKRLHFHRFMESVHLMLGDFNGQANPLVLIANVWAKDVDVLCFDEFFVNDIADAMLLAGLFDAMFSLGITLIATSNCAPVQLYKNGLQRERFLPTIDLINCYCRVISIDGPHDYRLNEEESTACHYRDFHIKANSEALFLKQHFAELASETMQYQSSITIHHRNIDYLALADDVVWFDFMAICSGPRSQRDYIKLADMFKVVLISSVPQFSGELIPAVFSGVEDSYQRSGVVMGELRGLDDEARRFIALVDEFYDRGIRLIIEADVDINELYQGSQLAFEFARCKSRLFEMQRLVY
ncbi:cell division protein ZapE [Cognaticolwellia mytili]|uniref:cell division protein ZapE n=1 Tax=Cognaticolwellia mytili TaxID=1888913 RepID=UPI000A170E89|nr:cell division protein ZapE [Cognaticolwellia mytili]